MRTLDWLRNVTDTGPVDLRDDTRFRPRPGSPVSVQVMGPNSLDVLLARDIALKGVGVNVPHQFRDCNVDAEVEIVITLPGQRPFLARGQVRHRTANYGDSRFFGIEFVELPSQRREQIRRYLSSGMPQRIN